MPDNANASAGAPPFPQAGLVYDAHHFRTIDGDTIDVIPFRVVRLRLLGTDTPERKEGVPYVEATRFTDAFCKAMPGPLRIATQTKDAFGRELAWVWDAGQNSLNDALIASGHAQPFTMAQILAEVSQRKE